MRKRWLVLVVPGGLFVVLAVFVLALLLIKLLWGWTVPDRAVALSRQCSCLR